MIKAVADRNAFHIGNQYLSENRVRIIEADDAQISSAVIGNSGLYEQTIRLNDGHLISKCSCALPEEPMCRHCIAVLLEYHRWAQPKNGQQRRVKPSVAPPTQAYPVRTGAPVPGLASPTDLKLSEVMAFIEWLCPALKALERGQTLPDSSTLAGDVASWSQIIRNLEERHRESEEGRINLESDMRDREAYVGRLTQQVQASMEETKVAQACSQQLQQALTASSEVLTKISEIASEVGSYESQLKSLAGEVIAKGSQLDKLAQSFRDVSTVLKALAKTPTIP